jgi:carnitine 3-dehydrogenase
MSLEPSSSRIAVVGMGVIGASWAAYFLAKGFDVAATDPADGAEERLRALVDEFWPSLERLGVVDGASRSRLSFDPEIMRAVAGCAFIQENGPERVDVKRDLLGKISPAVPSDSLIASSSSGIFDQRHPGCGRVSRTSIAGPSIQSPAFDPSSGGGWRPSDIRGRHQ